MSALVAHVGDGQGRIQRQLPLDVEAPLDDAGGFVVGLDAQQGYRCDAGRPAKRIIERQDGAPRTEPPGGQREGLIVPRHRYLPAGVGNRIKLLAS